MGEKKPKVIEFEQGNVQSANLKKGPEEKNPDLT